MFTFWLFAIRQKYDKMEYNNYQLIILLSTAHKLLRNQSQRKCGLRCGYAASRLLGLRFGIPPVACTSVFCE